MPGIMLRGSPDKQLSDLQLNCLSTETDERAKSAANRCRACSGISQQGHAGRARATAAWRARRGVCGLGPRFFITRLVLSRAESRASPSLCYIVSLIVIRGRARVQTRDSRLSLRLWVGEPRTEERSFAAEPNETEMHNTMRAAVPRREC